MSKKLSREEVLNVARLARLDLKDEEVDRFTGQLGKILEYASDIDELSLEGVEPTFHVFPLYNVLREDVVKPSLNIESVLKNAPDPLGDYFCVPRILDESESH